MEDGISILFGLSGKAVDRVERCTDADGSALRLVHVVAAASSAAGCPQCGVVSTPVKQWPGDFELTCDHPRRSGLLCPHLRLPRAADSRLWP